VIIMATEDSWTKTIGPRLIAANADMTRVACLWAEDTGQVVVFDLMRHGNDLLSMVEFTGAAVVFFDPLVSAMPGRKRNDGDEVRPAMEYLSQLAQVGNFAALGLMHLKKDLTGGDISAAISGSGEWVNVARAAFVAVADKESEDESCVLSLVKHNLGSAQPSERYGIVNHEFTSRKGKDITTGKVEWRGISDRSADDLVNDSIRDGGGDRNACRMWLKEWLPGQGNVNYQAVLAAADEVGGWSKSTVYRAGKELGVRSTRMGFGGQSTWAYP
jgi:hypothetical protein